MGVHTSLETKKRMLNNKYLKNPTYSSPLPTIPFASKSPPVNSSIYACMERLPSGNGQSASYIFWIIGSVGYIITSVPVSVAARIIASRKGPMQYAIRTW